MIYLTKDGIFYESDYPESESNYHRMKIDSVLTYLNDIIYIEDGFTLLDFFEIIKKDQKSIEILFGDIMGYQTLDTYIEEIKKDCLPESREEMDCIECSWVAEQFDYRKFYEKYKDSTDDIFVNLIPLRKPTKKDVNEIDIYIDVSGIGSDKKGSFKSYAIEYTPLYRLKHLPLRLNRNLIIRDLSDISEVGEIVVYAKKNFKVFDVFVAILTEISFAGGPENRDKILRDLSEAYNENFEGEEDDE